MARRLTLLILLLPLLLAPLVPAKPVARVFIYGLISRGNYGRLYELLENNGFAIDYADPEEFPVLNLTLDLLSSYDVVVLPDIPATPPPVVEAIVSYLKSGGGLLVIEYPFEEPSPLGELLGVKCLKEELVDPESPSGNLVCTEVASEVGYKVESVVIPFTRALAVTAPAKPALLPPPTAKPKAEDVGVKGYLAPLAIATYGSGRACFVNGLIFLNNYFLFAGDNAQFIVNVFNWLAGRSPKEINLEFQRTRTLFFIAAGVVVVALMALAIGASARIPLSGSKLLKVTALTLGALLAAYAGAVLHGYVKIGSLGGISFEYFVSFYRQSMVATCLLALYLLSLSKAYRVSPFSENMLKLMVGQAVGSIPLLLLVAHLWSTTQLPMLSMPVALGVYSLNIYAWLGVPFLWLMLRKTFEKRTVEPYASALRVSTQAYHSLLSELYGKYISPIYAIVTASYLLPALVILTLDQLWGGRAPSGEVFDLLHVNEFFVLSLAIAIFLLRKGPKYGFTSVEELRNVNALTFTREVPYLLIMLFLVPKVIGPVAGLEVELKSIGYVLVGVFIGYVVGYGVLWLYFKGVKEALVTIVTALIVMGYQWLVESMFLKPLTSILQQTTAAALAIAVSVALKRTLADFLKSVPAKPRRTRREELKELLRKLDQALIEGRISEETYRELKEKYEEKLRRLSEAQR